MTTVIAERTFDGPNGPLKVQIGCPYEPEGYQDEFWCPYSISDLGRNEVRKAIGGDSLQALVLCLYKIDADLKSDPAYSDGKLKWRGASFPGDLGTPSLI